jgi:hypothetical protein
MPVHRRGTHCTTCQAAKQSVGYFFKNQLLHLVYDDVHGQQQGARAAPTHVRLLVPTSAASQELYAQSRTQSAPGALVSDEIHTPKALLTLSSPDK